ncbi:DNA-binding response regulator [Limnohabitans sp. MORI2]|jgi:DNA-binding response OmpR family regulator|uniref:response regulator transcription factor n=1 Tax=Limnohabitans sp. MORI2 TaxID=1751150 RepID=UPI002377A1A2|nr:response regulator transcription factor [Limnohabitans sp. MORI2]BDU57786.1 DNA-binding response regulator [Limnohabitans sp. MORI2]
MEPLADRVRVLLIEDELKIAEFVIAGLSKANFEVKHCDDGESGLRAFEAASYDIVVLDVMLPKLNGLEVLQKIRQANTDVGVLMLSAKSELVDRLNGFELGADDYLPKPFYVEELVARIKALLHRKHPESVSQIVCKDLVLNLADRTAHWGDVSAVLSQREFSLLGYLMRSPGHIYSRQQILKYVWGLDFDPETNVVDVCVGRIKRKLVRSHGKKESPIESVRGVGYRLRTEALQ